MPSRPPPTESLAFSTKIECAVVQFEAVGVGALRGVGEPVFGLADHRGHGLAVGGQHADVAAGLVDELLDVEDLVLVVAQGLLVFEDGLGGVLRVDLGHQAAPRAHDGLEDARVAKVLDGLHGGVLGERHVGVGRWDARFHEREAVLDLVGTDLGGLGPVDDGDAVGLDELRRVDGATRREAPVDDDIDAVEISGGSSMLNCCFRTSILVTSWSRSRSSLSRSFSSWRMRE